MISTRRIREVYNAAPEHIKQAGRDAYPNYRKTLQGFATAYNKPLATVVAAFATLSPNNDYVGNLRSLHTCLANDAGDIDYLVTTTYNRMAQRAMLYLSGSMGFWETASGPKIRAFYHNILYCETSRKITIDGHMIAFLLDEDLTMTEAADKLRFHGGYEAFEKRMKQAAMAQGILGSVLQATLWYDRKDRLDIKTTTDMFTQADTGTPWRQYFMPWENEVRSYPDTTGT